MGTELVDYDDCERFNTNILFKRFYGGRNRGTCYQITALDISIHPIEITEKEFQLMMLKKYENEIDMIENKDTLYDGHIEYLNVMRPLVKYLRKQLGVKDED